jgi:hypothetical protein
MNHRLDVRRWVLIGLAITGLALSSPAFAFAANFQQEAMTREVETLFGQLGGLGEEAPVFTDLGGGFYTVSMTLPPGTRERLLEAMSPEEQEKMAAASLTVISVGQAPALPPSPVTTTHGALADTTYPYTYWIITLNLGAQTVTKTTTLKLTGPGLKFNRSTQVTYGANGIWGVGFRPGGGMGTPGIYTLQGSVSGGGSITTKSFAVHP